MNVCECMIDINANKTIQYNIIDVNVQRLCICGLYLSFAIGQIHRWKLLGAYLNNVCGNSYSLLYIL